MLFLPTNYNEELFKETGDENHIYNITKHCYLSNSQFVLRVKSLIFVNMTTLRLFLLMEFYLQHSNHMQHLFHQHQSMICNQQLMQAVEIALKMKQLHTLKI